MYRLLFVLLLLSCAAPAVGDDVIVVTPDAPTIVTAQQDAEEMAAAGVLRHCRRRHGLIEGIGFSTAGPQQAIENSCFYRDAKRGRLVIVDTGVAQGPRGWFAVVRYRRPVVVTR